jgi:hypothetical protein
VAKAYCTNWMGAYGRGEPAELLEFARRFEEVTGPNAEPAVAWIRASRQWERPAASKWRSVGWPTLGARGAFTPFWQFWQWRSRSFLGWGQEILKPRALLSKILVPESVPDRA